MIEAAALIAIMAVLARQSGGGLGAEHLPEKLTWLPEFVFAIPFGLVWDAFFSGIWATVGACAANAWAYAWMQTGHGSVLHHGNAPSVSIERRQTLSPLVDRLARIGRIEIGSRAYCLLFWSVKGFLIGLPVGGFLYAALLPVAYEIGNRVKNHAVSELLAGAFAGISILAFYYALTWILA